MARKKNTGPHLSTINKQWDIEIERARKAAPVATAAPYRFPYREHRTMAQVMADEAREAEQAERRERAAKHNREQWNRAG